MKPLLLVEFNELCPALVDKFISAGRLPNFKRLRDVSRVYTTDAEEVGEKLNPWVQWVTVHTGLSVNEHGVETLSDGSKVIGKNLWDILSATGMKSWICGSMNANYEGSFNGYLLPDPWSADVAPFPPKEFDSFFNFVRAAVQEHTNSNAPLGRTAALQFLTFMLRHGMSISTIWNTLRQLISERFANTRWRRASIMDQLQFDVFKHYWRMSRPDFATFFLNSTAHYQHCYWRHWEPEAFAVKPTTRELADYADAIPFGYRSMDRLIGKLIRLVGPECTIVFCTALSQEPYLKFENSGGRNYYRLKGREVLREMLELAVDHEFEPVMAEQFYLRFGNTQDTEEAANQLSSFRLALDKDAKEGDISLFSFDRRGESLLVQCNCTALVPETAKIWNTRNSKTVPFWSVFYRMDALKSGKHHPDGILWIRSSKYPPTRKTERISLASVAPMILDCLEVDRPLHMRSAMLETASQST